MKECRWFQIHLSTLVLLLVAGSFSASEPVYPLWDGSESVADYAKKVSLPPTQSLDLGNGVKLELVLIPAGQFIMGTPEPEKPIIGQTMVGVSVGALFVAMVLMLIRSRRKRTRLQFSMGLMLLATFVASIGVWGGVRWNDALKHPDDFSFEYPEHPVTLTQPFYMGKYEVTQEQYQAVIGENPSYFKGKDNPVENVSWDEAHAYCQKLSDQTKQTVQLPTEAEWEYSCRAGTKTKFQSGDTEASLDRVAWFDGNSKDTTHPVGQKLPNAWGLYDTHGNIREWCADWFGEYPAEAVKDPTGADSGHVPGNCFGPEATFRVVRGSSWVDSIMDCNRTNRGNRQPTGRVSCQGFRVVMRVSSRTP